MAFAWSGQEFHKRWAAEDSRDILTLRCHKNTRRTAIAAAKAQYVWSQIYRYARITNDRDTQTVLILSADCAHFTVCRIAWYFYPTAALLEYVALYLLNWRANDSTLSTWSCLRPQSFTLTTRQRRDGHRLGPPRGWMRLVG